MPPFKFVCPTNKIAHFVEVSLYLFYLAQRVKLDHAITATQKTILGAFGLDEDTIRAKAIVIGKELANSAKPEKEDVENGQNEDF